MWKVSIDDAEAIAIGAGILGTGGGGSPYIGKIHLQKILRDGYSVEVIDIDDVPDDATVTEIGWMGAPAVGIEKLPGGGEGPRAIAALESYSGRKIDLLICSEVGGANSIEPLITGAMTGKPVIDADAMGRAFPKMQMSTHFIYGVRCYPAVMCDEKGNQIIFGDMIDSFALERFGRDLCVQMGCVSILALPLMTGEEVKRTSVRRTMSFAKKVGDAILHSRKVKSSFTDAILNVTGGSELFTGKLVDVERRTVGGFNPGQALIEGLGKDRGDFLHIAFQNENLVAWRGDRETRGEVVACVPDLICLLEIETGEPITTEQLRYGIRVTVLGIPCTDKFRTAQALDVVGPAAFGYPEVTYNPMPKTPGQGIE